MNVFFLPITEIMRAKIIQTVSSVFRQYLDKYDDFQNPYGCNGKNRLKTTRKHR